VAFEKSGIDGFKQKPVAPMPQPQITLFFPKKVWRQGLGYDMLLFNHHCGVSLLSRIRIG
jgi:hypothetical protein